MKNISYKYLFVILIACLSSCSEDTWVLDEKKPATTSLRYNINYNSDWFEYGGNSKEISVETGKKMYHGFRDTPWWLSIDLDYTNSFDYSDEYHYTATADKNYSAEDRMGIMICDIAYEDWQVHYPIEVNQHGQGSYLYFDENGVAKNTMTISDIPADGGQVDIPLFTNESYLRYSDKYVNSAIYNYKYQYSELQKQVLKLDIKPNESAESRMIYIYIYRGDTSNYVTLSCHQLGQNVQVNTSVSFTPTGGTTSIAVTGSSVVDWTVSCSSTWLQAERSMGSIKLSAAENATSFARTAYVYVKYGTSTAATISVTQAAPTIKLSNTKITSDYLGQSNTITVTSDFDWSITDSPTWCTISPKNGKSGTTNVTITPTKNENLTSRSGIIKFGKVGWTVSQSLEIEQSAFNWGLDNDVINFEREASSKTVKINSLGTWNAYSDASWITLSPATGSGTADLTITVTANASSEPRTATIIVNFGGSTKEISVYQAGLYMSVASNSLSYDCYGGITNLYFGTNLDATWQVLVDENYNCGTDWIKFERQSDGTSDYIAVTTLPNNSCKPRGAYLILTPNDGSYTGESIRIPVTQTGRSLTVSISAITSFYYGGKSDEFIIWSDGHYKLKIYDVSDKIIDISDENPWVVVTDAIAYVTPAFPSEKTKQYIVGHKLTFKENTSTESRQATLVVSLGDLPDGETYEIKIPIVQYASGVIFGLDGWGYDKDWNIGTSDTNTTINLSGWSKDNNWDY